MLTFVAATLTAAGLIVPTSGVAAAQRWTTVTYNHMPMVEGSGRAIRQNRAVGAFDGIETKGSETVEVRVGARPSVVIEADDNILPLLTTYVRNGTLKIESRGSYRTHGPIRVWITTPDLHSVKTMGSGNVVVHGVNSERLDVSLFGSGDIQATGRARQLNVDLYGSGDARLGTIAATDVEASVYGSGDATVRGTGQLNAKVMGSGSVIYLGRPANVYAHRMGSGRVVSGG
jgi:hypothetical protein